MAQMRAHIRADHKISAHTAWTIGIVAVVAICTMFYILWRGQFAAAPLYVFDTPSSQVEAGYCLAVAQDAVPTGAPVGSYFDESAQFWIKRMRTLGVQMGPAITSGRTRLSADISRSGMSSEDWLQHAMEICSRRALMYGARFRTFD
ncbi:hypothetical protein [Paenirhodobacter sp.]|uniref:hypothetical protein n=1 Tax=Paenirhodobacter sp. TaxID=1965326 RepID=UPI003B4198C8